MVLLLAVAAVFYKRRRLSKTCLALAMLVLLIGGNAWIGRSAAMALERRYQFSDSLPQADAIVVLSEGMRSKAWPRRIVAAAGAGDRGAQAFELFRQGRAPLILCSGGMAEQGGRTTSEAEETRSLLQSLGVPDQVLLVETNGLNMSDSSVRCRPLLEARKVRRALLVTSALQMPRAMEVFRRQYPAMDIVPVPTAYLFPEKQKLAVADILMGCVPTAEHLLITEQSLKEYAELLSLRVRWWVVGW